MECEGKYEKSESLKYECLLFDVDDTLYPLSSGLQLQCAKNIQDFMEERLGIEKEKVFDMNRILYKQYGTTMAGLKALGYEFDYDDYHSFAHGRLPYEKLRPDPVLRSLLHSLPIRKVIFSNADEGHVAKVLSRLGLQDCFDDIICFDTLNPINKDHAPDILQNDFQHDFEHAPRVLPNSTPVLCKPFEEAFEQAFNVANINPGRTLFFDDSTRNIKTAKRMGLNTVLVGSSNPTEGADYALENIHELREVLSELWEIDEKPEIENIQYDSDSIDIKFLSNHIDLSTREVEIQIHQS